MGLLTDTNRRNGADHCYVRYTASAATPLPPQLPVAAAAACGAAPSSSQSLSTSTRPDDGPTAARRHANHQKVSVVAGTGTVHLNVTKTFVAKQPLCRTCLGDCASVEAEAIEAASLSSLVLRQVERASLGRDS